MVYLISKIGVAAYRKPEIFLTLEHCTIL